MSERKVLLDFDMLADDVVTIEVSESALRVWSVFPEETVHQSYKLGDCAWRKNEGFGG